MTGATITDIRNKHAPEVLPSLFFVLRRENGSWSIAAKVMDVFGSVDDAERGALALKAKHPDATFGVAQLLSETRTVAVPYHMVKAS